MVSLYQTGMLMLTRKKKIVFALIAMTISFVGMILVLLSADLVLHARAEKSAGLNRYGYRGPVVPKKQPGELRVVMLGGSTVFGYGVAWNETVPFYLEAKLRDRLNRPVRVVNLGFNNQGAFAFIPDLEDFAYLDYDVIVLYEGYNDLLGDQGVNRAVYRRDSAIYRLAGYFPILPLYLDEKVKMLRYGGDLDAAYREARLDDKEKSKVVFHTSLAQRTSAAALEAVAAVTKALDGQIAAAGYPPPAVNAWESSLGCKYPFITYCESMAAAVRYGLSHGKAVIVTAQPLVPGNGTAHERHVQQLEILGPMIAREFGTEPRVAFADFSHRLDLSSTDVTFDSMHLKPEANASIAAGLVDHVLKVSAKQ